jgi:ribonuclease E
MLDDDNTTVDNTPEAATDQAPEAPAPAKKAAAKRAPAKKAAAKKAPARKTASKKVAEAPAAEEATDEAAPVAKKAPARKAAAKRAPAKRASAPSAESEHEHEKPPETGETPGTEETPEIGETPETEEAPPGPPTLLLFKAPEPVVAPARKAPAKRAPAKKAAVSQPAEEPEDEPTDTDEDIEGPEDETAEGAARRRRRRGGRRRRKPGTGEGGEEGDDEPEEASDAAEQDSSEDSESGEGTATTRRRRVRSRPGQQRDGSSDDPANTVTRVRQTRSSDDDIVGFTGSTRLEAKKQRRREGREAGRRRAPIISEAEFLARREAVDRVMVIRAHDDLTQIAVLEDKVLVEHYVARESQTSLIGNVYLGRVQNVLPSMEAAFIDIGKGRNAVLYAGEVNWDSFGAKDGSQRKIEAVLKPGQAVLVQVTKDPIGHKGARLTSQISLPGRFLVYVPDGTTSGISRKLPDTERNRLKNLLKEIVPETAGVIVRTAAEGASEDELTHDVQRLTARWEDISQKVDSGNAPQLLYGEPDLTLKVVRDLFTEDFARLVISGDEAWETVSQYVEQVAPDLAERLEKHDDGDAFSAYRIDEQIAKGLDRKVWLPSGGSLIIDRTEAMTVVDVNTGKFTGSGGNLEETVTKNNLEAAEEIVRQLRLRDIGGIIVVDFIDMVLESNRDLVLRRLVECLGRDRTRHQVAEVTSLGLVQMTRKRIGTGLLEAFSENCDHCQGRGVIVHHEPVESKRKVDEEPRRARRNRGRGRAGEDAPAANGNGTGPHRLPTPADIAAMPRHEEPEQEDTSPAERSNAAHEASVAQNLLSEPVEPVEPVEPEPLTAGLVETEFPVVEQASEATPPVETNYATDEPAATTEPEVPAEPAPPAAPRIVTSVRRVSARRPAGPPAAVSAPVAVVDPETLDIPELEEHETVAPAHVPIKKKGARKR